MYYKMVGDGVEKCEMLEAAAAFGDKAGRQIARDELEGVSISTVFLVLNHSYEGPPVLFETMIFGGKHDLFQERYCTKAEAIEGHARALAMVMEAAGEDFQDESDDEPDDSPCLTDGQRNPTLR